MCFMVVSAYYKWISLNYHSHWTTTLMIEVCIYVHNMYLSRSGRAF